METTKNVVYARTITLGDTKRNQLIAAGVAKSGSGTIIILLNFQTGETRISNGKRFISKEIYEISLEEEKNLPNGETSLSEGNLMNNDFIFSKGKGKIFIMMAVVEGKAGMFPDLEANFLTWERNFAHRLA